MLKKLLFHNRRTLQFILATVGAFVGLSALFLSVQLFVDLNSFHSGDDELFGPNDVIIQKRVTKFTTIGLNSTDFTPSEIENLRQKDFIQDVAPFQSANFNVGMSEVEGDGLPHFYTDLFFQSIPDRFVDVDTDWEWNENSRFIPIILPRDFVLLINYGFAQSQGIPQISEDLLMAARLKIYLSGGGKREEMIGRVVGFSQKINTVLVPETFLTMANGRFSNGKTENASRLFITIADNSYGELEALTEKMNLDINESVMDIVQIKSIVSSVIGGFGIAAFLIILLSILGFLQYAQLMLSEASYEIQTLLRIGYAVRKIVFNFLNPLLILFGTLTISAFLLTVFVKKWWIQPALENSGIKIESGSMVYSLISCVLIFLSYALINFLNVKNAIRKKGKAS